jgi:hypothetical protein
MSGPPPVPRDPRPPVEETGLRFERADVDPGVVAKWAIGLGAVSVVTAAVAVWLLVFLRHQEEKSDPQRPPLYFSEEARQPEGVRLQTAPFGDLHTLREQEHQILDSYGWVDQAAGVVHIPIDAAMKLYLARQSGAVSGILGAPGDVPTDSAPVPSPMPTAPASPGGAR